MKKNLKINNACKQMVAISAATLMMISLPLSGCNSEQQIKQKNVSTESSSVSVSSVKESSDTDSDNDKSEKEFETGEEATKDTSANSSSSEVDSSDVNNEEQESSTPQSGGEETAAVSEEIVTEEVTEPVEEIVQETVETYYDPGDISGRLYIPDLRINVGLYTESAYATPGVAQSICDAADSAVYLYDYPGRALIGDHCNQDFSSLYNSYVGMPVYIYGQEYVCVDNGWGINNGDSIIIGGSDVQDINDGLTVLYTCASIHDTYDVWCVTVAPV